jgi:hypothetical protein
MAMHMWGDKDFDWTALNNAINEIYFWGNKVGRIGGQIKEKYGEVRWYAHVYGAERLSDLIYPGYHYYQWPAHRKPMYNIIDQVSSIYMRPFKRLTFQYQKFFYAFAYRMAIKKYPHVADEIIACVDHKELLFKKEKEMIKKFWEHESNQET